MLQNKVAIDMAKVDNAVAMPDADRKMRLVVGRYPRWWIIPWAEPGLSGPTLGPWFATKLADKPGKTIYVRADARAQYKAVEDAIDDVRTAGVDEVGLLTPEKGKVTSRAESRPVVAFVLKRFCSNRGSFKPWQCQWEAGGGYSFRHQCNAHDRRLAGAADHLHGHRAGDSQGSGCRWYLSHPKDPQKQQQPNDRTIVVQVLYRPGAPPATRSMRLMWPRPICWLS